MRHYNFPPPPQVLGQCQPQAGPFSPLPSQSPVATIVSYYFFHSRILGWRRIVTVGRLLWRFLIQIGGDCRESRPLFIVFNPLFLCTSVCIYGAVMMVTNKGDDARENSRIKKHVVARRTFLNLNLKRTKMETGTRVGKPASRCCLTARLFFCFRGA